MLVLLQLLGRGWALRQLLPEVAAAGRGLGAVLAGLYSSFAHMQLRTHQWRWCPECACLCPPCAPNTQLLGSGVEASPAEVARVEKFLKGRLAAAAEHFNRDQKKGFQYLQARCACCAWGACCQRLLWACPGCLL